MIVLRDIKVGGVFIFIRVYGLEKHCHAYQLALEQMAQCGCMYDLCTSVCTWCKEQEPDSNHRSDIIRPVNRREEFRLTAVPPLPFPVSFPASFPPSALHPWSASPGQNETLISLFNSVSEEPTIC